MHPRHPRAGHSKASSTQLFPLPCTTPEPGPRAVLGSCHHHRAGRIVARKHQRGRSAWQEAGRVEGGHDYLTDMHGRMGAAWLEIVAVVQGWGAGKGVK